MLNVRAGGGGGSDIGDHTSRPEGRWVYSRAPHVALIVTNDKFTRNKYCSTSTHRAWSTIIIMEYFASRFKFQL